MIRVAVGRSLTCLSQVTFFAEGVVLCKSPCGPKALASHKVYAQEPSTGHTPGTLAESYANCEEKHQQLTLQRPPKITL